MTLRVLTALPVYNEARHVREVIDRVSTYAGQILVVNDGSTDDTAEVLAGIPGIQVVTHPQNRGYGAALQTAFETAIRQDFDVLVTIDSDGQHEPRLIPELVAAMSDDVDIVSGSRYLTQHVGDSLPPADRRRVNVCITKQLNACLELNLTDAFCGFKAYRVSALSKLDITLDGYAMPLQLWVQAVALGMQIVEFPVPLVYLDPNRTFGGSLDDSRIRLNHYREVLSTELDRWGWKCRGEVPKAVGCES